jgi:ribosomal protein S18 acetylase RimI-like enzyme
METSIMPLIARDARLEDYAAFRRFFGELRVPDAIPETSVYEARIRPNAFFLWEAERPVAYAYWQSLGDVARVIHVVVDPSFQGRGIGSHLMREIATRARASGCSRWELNVKPDNVPALRLYEGFGLIRIARSLVMQIGWRDVDRLPADPEARAALVAASDDPRVEAAFGFARGQVAALRSGGRVILAVRRGEALVAFSAFDPSIPGGMPFVAPSPGLLRALLEAMRHHARPDLPFVRFVAQNESVVGAATAAGANGVLDVVRMAGPIVT